MSDQRDDSRCRAWRHAEPTTADIELGGHAMLADRSGALIWPDERILLVADLHFEKGSAFAARGRLLPPYDTRETLVRLANVIKRYAPRLVIALGDSLHDRGAADRLGRDEVASLSALQRGYDWIWITGNHDPDIGNGLGGAVHDAIEISGVTLQHAPSVPNRAEEVSAPSRGGEIAGHLHPVAKLVRQAQSLRRPCFIGNGRRLVVPAFGAFAGGLNVLDEAFVPIFSDAEPRVWMLGHDGVYPLAKAQLSAD